MKNIDFKLMLEYIVDNEVAHAILDMLAQKVSGEKSCAFVVNYMYITGKGCHLGVKNYSFLYEKHKNYYADIICPDAVCRMKSSMYAYALCLLLQVSSAGSTIVAINPIIGNDKVFMKPGTTYEQLLVELDLCLNTR